jgi:hypothetical protein
MKQLRIIPEDSLCPHCQMGYMVTSTMRKCDIKPGRHIRKLPAKCDYCGKPGPVVKRYVGVEVEVKDNTNQPNLFPELQSL